MQTHLLIWAQVLQVTRLDMMGPTLAVIAVLHVRMISVLQLCLTALALAAQGCCQSSCTCCRYQEAMPSTCSQQAVSDACTEAEQLVHLIICQLRCPAGIAC